MRILRIAMARIDPTVGNISGNMRLVRARIKDAWKAAADLVLFNEGSESDLEVLVHRFAPQFGL